ncbi:JmjC domain, hydroxylase-domain-containing protein [Scheffersomyces xylosifermentans]|uniref:JmjC domain, hydroxylase-domain-containing protein n=1 Tax=Scheffersomyces xylosifermentans TaxID=1304137 RepID=UPI00315DB91A
MSSPYKADPHLTISPAYYSGGIPVFKPTAKEFEDFYAFNKAINSFGMQSGIVKIIPPNEWLRPLPKCYTEKNLRGIKIKNPIVQQINGSGAGVFSLQNIEKKKTYDIFQWKKLAERSNYQPPAARQKSRSPDKTESASAPSPTDSKNTVPEPDSPTKRLRAHHHHHNELYNIDTSGYTPERCKELENNYWRTLTYAEPMYGADMLGTLFPDSLSTWNVAHLPNILDMMDTRLPGVNDAYLYAGLWKATFAWHLEDQDLYSINYLHFGAPKQWYSIPQAESERFFDLMKDTFNDEYKTCHEFLRHKTFLVSPAFLEKNGIQYNKIIHNEGEFIITYPFGFHAGFNYGYNLAESVNFALDDWFPFGEVTKKCECISDSVGINVKQLYSRFKGIPYVPGEDVDTESSSETDATSEEPEPPVQKKTNRQNKTTAEHSQSAQEESYDCYLCPNSFTDSAITENPLFQLIDTDFYDAKKKTHVKVHRICANMFPNELKIYPSDTHATTTVTGLDKVSKSQKKLQCKVCNKGAQKKNGIASHGACFQCSAPKCTRSFHGTCGVADGVVYSFKDSKHICKYHRSKKFNLYRFNKLASIKSGSGSWVQFVFNNTHYFGLVLANNIDEVSFKVSVYPRMSDIIEICYDCVIFPTAEVGTPENLLERSEDPVEKLTTPPPLPQPPFVVHSSHTTPSRKRRRSSSTHQSPNSLRSPSNSKTKNDSEQSTEAALHVNAYVVSQDTSNQLTALTSSSSHDEFRTRSGRVYDKS